MTCARRLLKTNKQCIMLHTQYKCVKKSSLSPRVCVTFCVDIHLNRDVDGIIPDLFGVKPLKIQN